MSQKKKIRDAFEDPEELDAPGWQTLTVSGPNTFALEETGKSLSRSSSSRRKRSAGKSLSILTSSSEFPIPSLYVATASTPTSPYSSPRTSMYNIEPQKLQRSDSLTKSPLPPQRSDSINVLRKSGPMMAASFIPPPPLTPHPSTIRRPSASPLATTPVGSPKNATAFSDDEEADVHDDKSTFRVEILHAIVATDFDSTSALLSRSASTIPKNDLSLRLLLHPLLPDSWRLCGSQRKNNALYCVENAKPAAERLVYIEETWQVINDKSPLTKTFAGKNAVLLACSVSSLLASSSPLTFNDRAVDCLVKLYLQANSDNLNPFLVLVGGKPLKITLRQAIAKHFFSVGFAVHHVHWQGLSTTADSKFVTHIAEQWTSCE